jgi:hypothetical protein
MAMNKRRSLVALGFTVLSALGVGACGAQSAPSAAPATPAYHASATSRPIQAGPAAPAGAAPAPPSAAAAESSADFRAKKADREGAASPAPTERPGLGTEWGETRNSRVYQRPFERMWPDRPNGSAQLFYNDREGARAMTRYADYREAGRAVVNVPGLAVTVSITDDRGSPLPGFYASGNTYAIGEAGQSYKIVVRNDGAFQIEAVASVDGLDVIDGRAAAFAKRGYLVPAYGSIEIEGFRQSADQIAAFRFGSVRDSYAARTGTDRNVGVVGLAVFAPRGAAWTPEEINRRHDADPFPGNYAAPPPPR